MKKRKSLISNIVYCISETKVFEIKKDVNLLDVYFDPKTDWFLILKIYSSGKMKRLFGENNLFKTSWVGYSICYNYFQEIIPNQDITIERRLDQKFITSYIPEPNFKKYIKYLNYPKVVDIPKIEISF
ncbi:MAG TPA: hypothetical protein PLP33_16175 [Leptospiraceae bacterium]|nr:hypothetical protein [Leptospiraceae bacterium]